MKIYRNPEVMWREEEEYRAQALEGLDDGENIEEVCTSVLYSGSVVLSLNLLGTEIWKLCDGRTMDEIVSELLEQFEVEPEVLRKDVSEFINSLKEKGFVRYE